MTDDVDVEIIHQWRWKGRFSDVWSDWIEGETPPIPAFGDVIEVRKLTIEQVLDPPEVDTDDGSQYVIWSNEHRAWWRPAGMGYAAQLEKAGIYTREQALKIVADSSAGWRLGGNPTEFAIPIRDAEEYVHPAARNID